MQGALLDLPDLLRDFELGVPLRKLLGQLPRALRDSCASLIPGTKYDPIQVSLAGLEI